MAGPRSWAASERAARELGRPGLERAVRRKKKKGPEGGEGAGRCWAACGHGQKREEENFPNWISLTFF